MVENYDQHYQMSVDDKFVVVNCPTVTDVADKLRDWNRARGDVDNLVVDGDCTDGQIGVKNVSHDVREKKLIH